MMQVAKKFFMTTIPFGIIYVGINMALGNEIDLWKTIFLTLFFGIIMTVFLNKPQKNNFKKRLKVKF